MSRSEAESTSPERWWRRLTATRWRVAWGYAGAVLLLVLARPTPASILWGLPLVIIGEGIRIMANGTLIKDKELTSFGLYAHLRHPLYVGSSLLAAGFAVMAGSLWLVAVMVVWFGAIYRRTITREEEKMEELFGASYRGWAATVPRFLPRRFAPSEIARYFTFRRAWINREQQGVLGAALMIAVLYAKYLLFG